MPTAERKGQRGRGAHATARYHAARASSRAWSDETLDQRRRLVREFGEGPHRCRVELHDHGVVSRQFDATHTFAWRQITAFAAGAEDLELRTTKGIVVVRSRAFADAAARRRFLAVVQDRLAAHPPPPTRS